MPHRKPGESTIRSSHDRRCAIPVSGCTVSPSTQNHGKIQNTHRTFAIGPSGLDHLVDLLLLPLLCNIGVCLGLISAPQRRKCLVKHHVQIIRSEFVLGDMLVKPSVLYEVIYDTFLHPRVVLGFFDGPRPNEADRLVVGQWCALDVICRKWIIVTYRHEAIEVRSHCVLLKKPNN